jgi:hypothetical protein
MLGVRRKGNWLLAAGISLLLSFAHLREEDLFADDEQQIAESVAEARQQALQTHHRQQLANQACLLLKGPNASAHLDLDKELICDVSSDYLAFSNPSSTTQP